MLDTYGIVEPSFTAFQDLLYYKGTSWHRDDLFWDGSGHKYWMLSAQVSPKHFLLHAVHNTLSGMLELSGTGSELTAVYI